MKWFKYFSTLIIVLMLIGCGSLSETPKMKPSIAKNYSNEFVELSETLVKDYVLLHKKKDELVTVKRNNEIVALATYLHEEYYDSLDDTQSEIVSVFDYFIVGYGGYTHPEDKEDKESHNKEMESALKMLKQWFE